MSELADGYEGYSEGGKRVYLRCLNCKREQVGDELCCPVCFPGEAELDQIYDEVKASRVTPSREDG